MTSETRITDVEEIWFNVRLQRAYRLEKTDWTQMPDSPLSAEKKAEFAQYRQQLRDLPVTFSSATDLEQVVFPTEPTS